MSCQDEFFMNEEELVKETWAKPIIDGEYKNIDFIIYRGGYEKNSYSNKNKLLKLHIEDTMPYTFKKTYMALNMIWNEFKKYDYVFRTNTSTYVNVPLLNELIQRTEDDSIAYFSDIYSLSEQCAPYPLCLGGRGNGIQPGGHGIGHSAASDHDRRKEGGARRPYDRGSSGAV